MVATLGIALSQVTGNYVFDGIASVIRLDLSRCGYFVGSGNKGFAYWGVC